VALHSEPDQWLLSPPVQAQLPLLEFALHDSANTRVYVSARSGEVVLASTAGQRRWAWLGAVPHWLYFTALRRHLELWTQVVIWLSAAGTVGVLTGLLLGLSRFRYRRLLLESRRGVPVARSPFRERWMRWHHYLGLGFGCVVLTWVVSGLLSMNPGGWSPGMTPTAVDHQRWQGGPAEAATYRVSPGSAWHAAALEFPVGELRFVRVDGEAYYRAVGSDGRSRLVTAGRPILTSVAELPQGTLLQAVRSVVPDGVVASAERLQEYDSYYYVQEGDRPPLPVYRFVFADRAHTRVYVDPAAARVVRVAGPRARLERWLYNGLHDLDFPGFINRRPLWDIVMIGLLLGGLTLSVTGTILAWRWVRRWVVG
jgi:hypothetical protein